MVTGVVMYPWAQAEQVLDGLREILLSGPDELTVQTAVAAGPDGGPTVMLLPTWCGDPEADGPVRALGRLGDPLAVQLDTMPLAAAVSGRDALFPNGRHVSIRTRPVAGLTPVISAALMEAGAALPSPMSALSIHQFRNAATRVPVADTAFGTREPHLTVEVIAVWPAGTDGTPHRAWADSTSAKIAPHSLPGGYANMLAPDDTEQIAHAFGGNAARLLEIKARVDPDGVFTAIPLPKG
ncbi:hypothetical protein GCM10022254_75690 [Actinomadura meridiana]|uniref:Berberine/berberine-like domain-containing protein n=1 Tax=Actinomadura meridiana TaxID=559626 RepID=A0ABP8CR94_9ACTN